jgi:hypothetical protein
MASQDRPYVRVMTSRLVLMALVGALALIAATPAPAVASGAIRGTVTDNSGKPIANAFIWVVRKTGTTSLEEVAYESTNANGVYYVNRLPAGTNYRVHFGGTSSATFSEWYDDKGQDFPNSDPITVVDGAVTLGVDATLRRWGKITGRVTNRGGDPIPGVGVRVIGDFDASDTTDADGFYEVYTYDPTVKLQFIPRSGSPYIGEYHRNKPTVQQANVITVGPDEVYTADAQLAATGGSIAGTITRNDGQAAPGAVAIAYGASGVEITRDVADALGQYFLVGLGSGSYRVGFSGEYLLPEFHYNKTLLANGNGVAVTAGATTRVDPRLAATGIIRGVVRNEDGNTLKGARVSLVRGDGRHAGPFVTGADGGYQADALLPGSWRVRFAPPHSGYLATDYASLVTVTERVTVSGIDATLARAAR